MLGQNNFENKVLQIDSLRRQLKSDSIHIFRNQKYRPYLHLDQRNSFIRNNPVNVNGLQIGILIKEKHVIGIGGYGITSTSHQKVKTKTENNIEAERVLEMKYLTVFYQYIAISKRFFELDFKAEIGQGKFDLKLYDSKTNNLISDKAADIFVSGIGPQLIFKPFKWLGITLMGGYRFTFETNYNLNFNGPYYGYGVWLDIRRIYRNFKFYSKKRNYKRQVLALNTIN